MLHQLAQAKVWNIHFCVVRDGLGGPGVVYFLARLREGLQEKVDSGVTGSIYHLR